jgi:FkbM family methyltransferase
MLAGLAHRLKPSTFTGRLIRFPLKFVPRGKEISILSGINKGMRWITGTGPNSQCWLGHYESDHISALAKLIRPGAIVYDVGANAGYYTLAFSRMVGSAGRVYAFEPDSRNADTIRRHIEINRLSNVTFVQAAVSNSSGMVGFDPDPEKGAAGKIESASISSYMVPAISLDDFIAAGNPVPSFIKMDIEGAEYDALVGAKKLLAQRAASWFLATHSVKLRNDCKSLLTVNGYRLPEDNFPGDDEAFHDFLAFPVE